MKKKSLGQHFLKSRAVIALIISAAEIAPGETVLEVGPGAGALTEALLAAGAMVIAVEKDAQLTEFLKFVKFIKFIKSGQLQVIGGNILDKRTLWTLQTFNLTDYKVVSNIPYYLTGKFLRLFLEELPNPPKRLVLMLQKEVADRILARDGIESILSISVKKFALPKHIITVKAREFSPRPKVSSAVIRLDRRENPLEIDLGLVKQGFSHKRKLVSSNLKMPVFPGKRAENLSTLDWVSLSKETGEKVVQ